MNNYERIDAFEVNFVDSAARKEFKLNKSTGAGESRIYVGHDEEKYDEFFEFENVKFFFARKDILKKYLEDSKEEYMNPSQLYTVDISEYYNENVEIIDSIQDDIIKFKFRKTFDKQNRYYLVLDGEGQNRINYNYIRNICLPKVTKFCFVKLVNKKTKEKIIYLQPIFFNALEEKEEITEIGNESKTEVAIQKKNGRLRQSEYRQKLLDAMPFCPFTNVADDRLLVACHIKPHKVCNDEEKYDYKNGITMTPTYHLIFDLGFISFENNGKLMVSPFLSNTTKKRLNLKEGEHIRIQNGSDKYLEYHRNNVFCKMPNMDIE